MSKQVKWKLIVVIILSLLTLILSLFMPKHKTVPKLLYGYSDLKVAEEDLGWTIYTPVSIDGVEEKTYQYYDNDVLVAVYEDVARVSKGSKPIVFQNDLKYIDRIRIGKYECEIYGAKLNFTGCKWQAGNFYYAIELKNPVDIYKMTDYVKAVE